MIHRAAQLIFLMAFGQLFWTPGPPPSQAAATLALSPANLELTLADVDDDPDPSHDGDWLQGAVTSAPRSHPRTALGPTRILRTPLPHRPGRNLPLRLGGADSDPDPAATRPDHD